MKSRVEQEYEYVVRIKRKFALKVSDDTVARNTARAILLAKLPKNTLSKCEVSLVAIDKNKIPRKIHILTK